MPYAEKQNERIRQSIQKTEKQRSKRIINNGQIKIKKV